MSKTDTDRFAREAMSQDSSSSARFDAMQIPAYGLTISPTWLWAIMHAGKDVENRSPRDRRRLERGVGEVVALTASLHESHQREQQARDAIRKNSTERGTLHSLMPSYDEVRRMRGHWCAVALIRSVTVGVRSRKLSVSSSPWAESERVHVLLDDVFILPEPIVAKGALGLWETKWCEPCCVVYAKGVTHVCDRE